MRSKRLRSGSHGSANGSAYGYSGDGATATELLDPSLMTERQQLAFLLRKTAPEASSSPSSSSSSSSSDNDDDDAHTGGASAPRTTRPARRVFKRAKMTAGAPVVYCGRGRPPKNALKLPAASHKAGKAKSASTRLPPASKGSSTEEAPLRLGIELAVQRDKSSPSSTSDVMLLGAGSRRSSLTSTGASASASACALCCELASFCDAPLFLCPACDRKYPTQQALGRACMT